MSLGNWAAIVGVGLAFMASAVGATWRVSSSIADVRDELKTEIAGLRTEIAGIGGKLDIIIGGLNIEATPAEQ